MNQDKYEQSLKVLSTALSGDREHMKLIVKVGSDEYELENVMFEQFVDENADIRTRIVIKVWRILVATK